MEQGCKPDSVTFSGEPSVRVGGIAWSRQQAGHNSMCTRACFGKRSKAWGSVAQAGFVVAAYQPSHARACTHPPSTCTARITAFECGGQRPSST